MKRTKFNKKKRLLVIIFVAVPAALLILPFAILRLLSNWVYLAFDLLHQVFEWVEEVVGDGINLVLTAVAEWAKESEEEK